MTAPLLPLANLSIWLTPIWLLSLGVTIGAAILLVLWCVLWVVRRDAAQAAWLRVQEGVLAPLNYVVLAMVAICLLAAPAVETDRIVESLRRLSSVTQDDPSFTVPPHTEDFPIAVNFRAEELVQYEVRSDQDVRLANEKGIAYKSPSAVVQGEEPYLWTLNSKLPRGFQGDVSEVYLTNESDAPAQVTLAYKTEVRVPQVYQLGIIAGSVVALYLLCLLSSLATPGIANIATATFKEATGQPLFLLFMLVGGVALVIYIVLPYNTMGEDVKMLKQSGLETIMVLSIIFAVWTSSVTVADEIEGKTALTLLSKPISRRQFILGKYLGITWSVLAIFVVLGALLLATVSFKVVYDARETSNPTPDWQQCYNETVQIVPGLVLSFLETATLAAVSVAISTRLPMLPNLIICGAIYVLGHLTPLIAQSSVGELEFVQFFAKLFAVILPELDHFNIQAAVAAGQPVPYVYLGWAALYAVIYCTFAMLLALLLFEDRDLA